MAEILDYKTVVKEVLSAYAQKGAVDPYILQECVPLLATLQHRIYFAAA